MMKNKLVFIVVFLLALAILGAVLYSRNLRKQIDETNARISAESAAKENGGQGDGLGGMSLSGLDIVQGEKGRELWRLKAQNAVMSGQGGDIVAQKPYLTYYLNSEDAGAERQVLLVESDTGDLNQQEDRIRFIGNVVATRADDELLTSLILYDGKNKRLNCPEESFISSPGMSGKAREMSWHLDDNTLHASGGVSLDVETDRMDKPSQVPVGK